MQCPAASPHVSTDREGQHVGQGKEVNKVRQWEGQIRQRKEAVCVWRRRRSAATHCGRESLERWYATTVTSLGWVGMLVGHPVRGSIVLSPRLLGRQNRVGAR